MSSFNDVNPSPGPRVLPKVFSDVPSAAELVTAQQRVSAANSSRNMLGLIVVLLLGMLIAAGVALVYFESQARELPNTITELEEKIKELEQDIKVRDADIADLEQSAKDAIEEYTIIDQRLKKNDELRSKIRETLEKKPSAAKVRRPALGTDDSHTALEDPVWLQLRANAEERLGEETKELEEIAKEVEAYRPPRRTGGGLDPRN
ncbi:MAG: hypothetical protein AAGA48_26395 [Myxococcota bacterium]